jgi:hypothetical protein
MCATPHPKHQAVLAAFVAGVVTHTAVLAAPVVVAKVILSAPTPGAVVGAAALVAKKAKTLKESALAMLDESTIH